MNFILSAPLQPIGFRISKTHVISDERAVITLVWFTQGADESLPQSFELTVTPQPLVPFGNIISSPFNVTVSPQYPYRASLTAVNCIGRSRTIILVIGKLEDNDHVTYHHTLAI